MQFTIKTVVVLLAAFSNFSSSFASPANSYDSVEIEARDVADFPTHQIAARDVHAVAAVVARDLENYLNRRDLKSFWAKLKKVAKGHKKVASDGTVTVIDHTGKVVETKKMAPAELAALKKEVSTESKTPKKATKAARRSVDGAREFSGVHQNSLFAREVNCRDVPCDEDDDCKEQQDCTGGCTAVAFGPAAGSMRCTN